MCEACFCAAQVDLWYVCRAVSLFARAMDKWQAWGEGGPEGCCLQTALRGLSDFVTSHHGCHHDAGCQVGPTLPCHWTPTEASLFARALDECGKNFGAIKKDFLPWKPVKSLIEFYYQGRMPKQEDDDQQGAGCSSGANCSGSNCVKKEPEVKEEPVEQEEEPCEEVEEKKEEETALAPTAAEASTTASAAEGEEEGPGSSGGAVSGPEVKPMRAKPLKNPEEGPNGAPVGSLKFFLGEFSFLGSVSFFFPHYVLACWLQFLMVVASVRSKASLQDILSCN